MQMEKIFGLQACSLDNVATIFGNGVENGSTIMITDKAGGCQKITARQAIPYGHKIAICHIFAGSPVVKYGEAIGLAMSDIKIGDYVHVHNLESQRGRGDWE